MRYGKCSSRQRPRDADEMVVVIKRRKHWLSRGPLDREAACITAVEKPGIFASKFASLERDQAPALGEHLLGMARFRGSKCTARPRDDDLGLQRGGAFKR